MNERDMKTVILLDRSAKFLDKAKDTVDFTIREGPRQKKLQVDKNIWTCCLEGVYEIHRILSDVYPQRKLELRFAVADDIGSMTENEWTGSFMTRDQLMASVKKIRRPLSTNTAVTLTGGLTMAIEALAVETPEQKEYNYDAKYNTHKRTSLNSEVTRFGQELLQGDSFSLVQNKGNLILYTRLQTEEEMEKLQMEVATLVKSINKIANSPSNKTFCAITSLRLFIVNFYAAGEKCTVKTHPLEPLYDLPLVKVWVISRRAIDMPDAVHSLLMAAFDLSSTTVTKIPMKEDNRGSTNYDVELFHSSRVHTFLKEAKLIDKESKNANNDEGVTYDTMRLAWTTAPKKRWSLFPHHGDSVPCTTVQAYSRPSACLTQFVRDGRCVMLDLEHTSVLGMNMPNKLVSHLLVANKGRIFIQEVDFIQKQKHFTGVLKHPSRLRAPKERINIEQLKHTYKQMELKMVGKNRMNDKMTEKEREKWKKLPHSDIDTRFLRISKNIPVMAKDTFIFHEPVQKQLEPLITMITKLKLSDKDVESLNKAIVRLLQIRNQRELIVEKDVGIGPCSVKNLADPAEQMRVALVELAKHLMKYVALSGRHEMIYKSFMTTLGVDQLLNIDANDANAVNKTKVTFPFFGRSNEENNSKTKAEDASKNSLTRWMRKRQMAADELVQQDLEQKRRETKKRPVEKPIVMPKEVNIDIFANICAKIERKESRIRREFVGRETHGNKAPLYTHMTERTDRSASPVAPERTERVRNADRGGSGTPPPSRRPYN